LISPETQKDHKLRKKVPLKIKKENLRRFVKATRKNNDHLNELPLSLPSSSIPTKKRIQFELQDQSIPKKSRKSKEENFSGAPKDQLVGSKKALKNRNTIQEISIPKKKRESFHMTSNATPTSQEKKFKESSPTQKRHKIMAENFF